jgi:hypothetical protein
MGLGWLVPDGAIEFPVLASRESTVDPFGDPLEDDPSEKTGRLAKTRTVADARAHKVPVHLSLSIGEAPTIGSYC